MVVKAIPERFHPVTPDLVVKVRIRCIEFYKRAFGAFENYRHNSPDGKSIVAMQNSRSGIRLSCFQDEFIHGDMEGCRSPKSIGGSAVTLHIYTEDVDKTVNQAVSAGATVTMPVTHMFWGDDMDR